MNLRRWLPIAHLRAISGLCGDNHMQPACEYPLKGLRSQSKSQKHSEYSHDLGMGRVTLHSLYLLRGPGSFNPILWGSHRYAITPKEVIPGCLTQAGLPVETVYPAYIRAWYCSDLFIHRYNFSSSNSSKVSCRSQ